VTLFEAARELANRLGRIFLKDTEGRRPVYGGTEKFQQDRHWRHLVLFFEYFHGDNGAGLGASHQTGWTALVAGFLCLFARLKPEDVLEHGVGGPVTAFQQARVGSRKSRRARQQKAVTTAEPAIAGRSSKRASFWKPRSRRLREE
ncbi:MAG TPA: hypothetical protein VK615_10185, partial [Candidatus Binatia bacterium]|nr:hypothetical protein [Candidatus Binatia bacterium]